MRASAGFSIVELLVAAAITMTIAAAAFALTTPSQAAFQSRTEAADLQQRLRVGAGALVADLTAAGSGPDRGPFSGPLLQAFAPVLPYRRGTTADDPPGSYFSDRITLVAVPPAAPSTTLASGGPPLEADWMAVSAQPQCPAADPLCLFAPNVAVALFDDSGAVDIVGVTAVDSSNPMPMLQHADQRLAFTTYRPDASVVVGVSTITYAFDASNAQLVVSNGLGAPNAPIVDNVVAVAFRYYGDPQPPGPSTYGPTPPSDEPGSSASWPPGENCVIAMAGEAQVPRLPVLDGGPGLVALTPSQLTDGPWCPDASSANRWDADLLRVRTIAVTLRVQAAIASLRGPAGVLFTRGGTSGDATRWVPDREVTLTVTPRNLNLGRAP